MFDVFLNRFSTLYFETEAFTNPGSHLRESGQAEHNPLASLAPNIGVTGVRFHGQLLI